MSKLMNYFLLEWPISGSIFIRWTGSNDAAGEKLESQ